MSTQHLPGQAGVVIIGGGIVGCSTAYFLAKRGADVVLVEKGELSDEQSGLNWGWIRRQGRNPREIPLAMRSIGLWSQFAQGLNTDIEWIQERSLRLGYTEEDIAKYEAWTKDAREVGLDTKMLSAGEVKDMIPALEGPYLGGAYTPTDGQAEPRKATIAVAAAAQEYGAKIYTNCAAEGIEVTNGAVTGVATERGGIKTDVLVCAAGAWSSKVGRMVGLRLPQRSVRATVAATRPTPPITHTAIFGPGVALRQKGDGTLYIAGGGGADYDVTLESFRHLWLFLPNYRRNRRNLKLHIGKDLAKDIARTLPWSSARKHPFAHTVGVEPRPNLEEVERSRQNLVSLIPSLGDIRIQRTWAGIIDATPDAVPVLGEVPGVKGFIFGTGFSGHGFAMGPGAGQVLSELILDGKTSVDIHPLRYSRFEEKDLADWTKTI